MWIAKLLRSLDRDLDSGLVHVKRKTLDALGSTEGAWGGDASRADVPLGTDAAGPGPNLGRAEVRILRAGKIEFAPGIVSASHRTVQAAFSQETISHDSGEDAQAGASPGTDEAAG